MGWVTVAISALGTLAVTFATLFAGRRQKAAETGKTVAETENIDLEAAALIKDTALSLMEPLRQRVADLEAAAEVAEQRRADDHARIVRLEEEAETERARNHIMRRHMRPIVDWLDDGALPPPPPVHPDLRDLL